MDCDAFEANLVDLLYEELDESTTNAMLEHAAGCTSCTAKREKLERAQHVFRSGLTASSPSDLEDKIIAATERAQQTPVPVAAAPATGGAKIFRFFARPEIAIAATILLFIGGALVVRSSSRKAESNATAAAAPAAASAIAARDEAQPADPTPPSAAQAAPTTTAPPTAEGEPGAVAGGMASAVALADGPAAPRHRYAPAPRPAAAPAPPAKPAKARADDSELLALGNKDSSKGAEREVSPFSQAKALFDRGQFAEAERQFDALASSNPSAALYAARCVAKLRGCVAAVPRFDQIARDNAGSAVATQAARERAKCEASQAPPAANVME